MDKGMIKVNYQELLRNPLWIKRRNEILSRDKNTCQLCGAQDKYLHVHHRYYTQDRMPWEYENDALVTLCEDCHIHIHDALSFEGVHIGDMFTYEHSDFENTCIVYDINVLQHTISLLEYDNGAGLDSIFDYTEDLTRFKKKYRPCLYYDSMFPYWFVYVHNHLEKTPRAFQFFYADLICRNRRLSEILKRKDEYQIT